MSTEANTESTIPTVSEDSNTLGDIRINHSVVASIVRLAALEVSGVAAVGGGFVDGIAEIFSKKGDERGVRVEEDEVGDYRIEIRVILKFGVELAAVAGQVQQRIAEQIEKMTSKNVARVTVVIDGVRTEEEVKRESETGSPHRLTPPPQQRCSVYDEQRRYFSRSRAPHANWYLYIAGGALALAFLLMLLVRRRETDRRI